MTAYGVIIYIKGVNIMIIESLKALLFGMIGIFVTMGVITAVLFILNIFSKEKKDEQEKK